MWLFMGCVDWRLSSTTDPVDAKPVITVDPSSIDFGSAPEGDERRRTVIVGNDGDALLMVNPAIARGGRAFDVDAESFQLEPGDELALDVRWSPVDAADAGVLTLASNDGEQPEVDVGLAGRGALPLLGILPSDPQDLGDVSAGCAAAAYYELQSIGDAPVRVTDLLVQGDGYTLSTDRTPPFDLAPGDTEWVTVWYANQEGGTGPRYGQLQVIADDAAGEHDAALTAHPTGSWSTEHFDQIAPSEGTHKADLLLYVDGSGSMSDDQVRVEAAYDAFVAELETVAPDWQLLVTSRTDGCTPGLLGPSSTNPAETLEDAWGHTDGVEAGLTVATNALKATGPGQCNEGFLRPDAAVTAILVSDEAEQSSKPWNALVEDLLTMAPSLRISAIVTPTDDAGYHEATAATGGQEFPITETSWEEELVAIADLAADALTTVFVLHGVPNESTIEVDVNGTPVDGWHFDTSLNAIVFDATATPPAGASIDVVYAPAGGC